MAAGVEGRHGPEPVAPAAVGAERPRGAEPVGMEQDGAEQDGVEQDEVEQDGELRPAAGAPGPADPSGPPELAPPPTRAWEATRSRGDMPSWSCSGPIGGR